MESQIETAEALECLMMQLAEGVDEFITDTPLDRFAIYEAELEVPKSKSLPQAPVAKPEVQAPPRDDFAQYQDVSTLLLKLREALPQTLTRGAQHEFELLGHEAAEIAVIIDPPSREADQMGNLEACEKVLLLQKSLLAIGLACDARAGQEPKAAIAFLPFSPWRVAQDRKLFEQENEILQEAMLARLKLRNFKHVVLAGANIGSMSKLDLGIPSTTLIPPSLMLREPLLKRKHWELLKKFHFELDKVLKI